MIQWSYAICVVSKYLPDSLAVIRKDCPLVIGKGFGECYISSDIPAILSFTKDFYLLNNYEYVFISMGSEMISTINFHQIH